MNKLTRILLVPTKKKKKKELSTSDNSTERQKCTKSSMHTVSRPVHTDGDKNNVTKGKDNKETRKKKICKINISCSSNTIANTVTSRLAIWKENSSSRAWHSKLPHFLKAVSKAAQQLVAFFPRSHNTFIWVSENIFGMMALNLLALTLNFPSAVTLWMLCSSRGSCRCTTLTGSRYSMLANQTEINDISKPAWTQHLRLYRRANGTAAGLQLCKRRCSLHQGKQAKHTCRALLQLQYRSLRIEAQVINKSSIRHYLL